MDRKALGGPGIGLRKVVELERAVPAVCLIPGFRSAITFVEEPPCAATRFAALRTRLRALGNVQRMGYVAISISRCSLQRFLESGMHLLMSGRRRRSGPAGAFHLGPRAGMEV